MVVGELDGGEDEDFPEPRACLMALSMIFAMGSSLESAFVSTMIPIPSSGAAATAVETPGAPPV